MSNFLKETFRPYTEEERQVINRHHRQRAVAGLIGMAIMLVVMLIVLAPMISTRTRLAGTWIAFDEHADGFQPEDAVLEFRDGVFYRNGKNAGMPKTENGRLLIHVQAPAGKYDKFLSVNDEILTIEYEPPRSAFSYSNDAITGVASMDWAAIYAVQQSASDNEDRRVVETYVLISRETGLTDEQLDELY